MDKFSCTYCGRDHPKCSKSGKRSYRTRAEAKEHRIKINSKAASSHLHDEYRCSCGWWHVTSKRKEVKK